VISWIKYWLEPGKQHYERWSQDLPIDIKSPHNRVKKQKIDFVSIVHGKDRAQAGEKEPKREHLLALVVHPKVKALKRFITADRFTRLVRRAALPQIPEQCSLSTVRSVLRWG
jgi:hypothetical protein